MSRVLIIGSGGREHALAWKLRNEGHKIYAAPGNPGIAQLGECVRLDLQDYRAVAKFVKENEIRITIVGPEAPLAAGIVNYFRVAGYAIVGPTRQAAKATECSKIECYKLLHGAHVPVPHSDIYDSYELMAAAVADRDLPFVIKYDDLAAGKGAVVVRTAEQLEMALKFFKSFPPGGYLVQEYEEGQELSFFEVTEGYEFRYTGSCWDVKPIRSGGENTGGMGGGSPHPQMTKELQKKIERTIVAPTINALRLSNRRYSGVMYFQLMLTARGPVVIEINCRFGDPEAQLLMSRLESELLPLLEASAGAGSMTDVPEPRFSDDVAVCVVGSAAGYPGKPRTGDAITGLDQAMDIGLVFQAGTKLEGGILRTGGGRITATVGRGETYRQAREQAYEADALVTWDGKYRRDDIAEGVIAGRSEGTK